MSFEEKFPELSKGKFYYANDEWCFSKNDVEKFCLDKSLVIQQIKETFADADVDSRGILFEFTESDYRDLLERLEE